jgi:hypothetical protein
VAACRHGISSLFTIEIIGNDRLRACHREPPIGGVAIQEARAAALFEWKALERRRCSKLESFKNQLAQAVTTWIASSLCSSQ